MPAYYYLVPDEDDEGDLSPGAGSLYIRDELLYNIVKEEVQKTPNLIDGILPMAVEKRKELFKAFRIDLAESEEDFLMRYCNTEIKQKMQFNEFYINIEKRLGNAVTLEYYPDELTQLITEEIPLRMIMGVITHKLAFYPIGSCYILPVERNSIFTFNNELRIGKTNFFEAIKDSQETVGRTKRILDFARNRITRYPKAVREALDVADDIANISRTASPYYDFGVEVEQSLLRGKVGVGEGGEVHFAPNKDDGKSFSFQLSSSAVKTLSSLIIYLKYQAKPNELLIIDEPELNLHPDNQVLLARVFARMINKGIRLLISTHSDYIIRELNNLIMLSADEPALRKVAEQYGYNDDERIRREDVGVYLFQFKKPEDAFVTVEELPVSADGFEVPTIDEAIRKLNKISEDIFYTLQDSAAVEK